MSRLPLSEQILNLQAGSLFQQWVVTELFNRINYLGRQYRLYFWRTVSGAEVDVILETPKELIPIEVKWTDNPRPADARHLHSFLAEFPRRAKRGFIVCRAPRRLQMSERVTAIPWQDM